MTGDRSEKVVEQDLEVQGNIVSFSLVIILSFCPRGVHRTVANSKYKSKKLFRSGW